MLARLLRRKSELLKVLERPQIPLHTNATKNDLRACVTKLRISGGKMSAESSQASDIMLVPMRTCQKLGISFFAYIGSRFGLNGNAECIPPLARSGKRATDVNSYRPGSCRSYRQGRKQAACRSGHPSR
ncbi:hypothetical protein RGQ15_20150 [Paracoccus sp. MBLB3053]|uniref:Uncharacterized protein n=1 Tax=Paracoccus aurantius TaxID=3073814 RepID=A0ABU2HXT8_9RHOB|nr:hypothetical protein [Paracoccus sp. MBLB3053]MDS9469873.1 hypothetical protein [Paracoccus sp. MBLB3053]